MSPSLLEYVLISNKDCRMYYEEGHILHQKLETLHLINNAQNYCSLNNFTFLQCQWHYKLMPTSIVIFTWHLPKIRCFVEPNITLTTASLRFKITCCILKIVYIFWKGHFDSIYFDLATTFLQWNIFASTRYWSLFLVISSCHKCCRPSKTLCYFLISVQGKKFLGINLMGSCNSIYFLMVVDIFFGDLYNRSANINNF